MKCIRLLIICLIVLLSVGCRIGGSGAQSDDANQQNVAISNIDFNGVWLYETTTTTHLKSTGEKIYTENYSSRIVMQEYADGLIRYNECSLGDTVYTTGAVTDQHLYLGSYDSPFNVIDETSLIRERQYELAYAPDNYYEETATITKLDSGASVEQGRVTLSGGGFLNEDTKQSCVIRWHHPSDIEGVVEIHIPFDGDYISLRINYNSGLVAGDFPQTISFDAPEFGLLSSAFFPYIGSNSLTADDGTLTITEYSDSKLTGSFDFISWDSQEYSGSFNINL